MVGNADTAGDPFSAPYSGPTGLHVKIGYTDATIVPEPGTGSLLSAALIALGLRARRQSHRVRL